MGVGGQVCSFDLSDVSGLGPVHRAGPTSGRFVVWTPSDDGVAVPTGSATVALLDERLVLVLVLAAAVRGGDAVQVHDRSGTADSRRSQQGAP